MTDRLAVYLKNNPYIKSEQLDRRIVFYNQVETQSDTGFVTTGWTYYMGVWAYVRQTRGREYHEADNVNAEVIKYFRIRYRRNISPKMRIVYESRNYDILEIRELGRREGLLITAKAEVL